MTTNTELFTDNFKAVFLDGNGKEDQYDIQLQNYYKGHVVGKTWNKKISLGLRTEFSCFSIRDSLAYIDTSLFAISTGEEHSRVQAHIDGEEFSAHILTEETEYNVEVMCSHMFHT